MSRLRRPVLAAILLAALSQGCSLTEPPSNDASLNGKRRNKAVETPNTLEAAERVCKSETERKGIGSVVGILSRLRKGSAEEDYRACMKARGYEVKS